MLFCAHGNFVRIERKELKSIHWRQDLPSWLVGKNCHLYNIFSVHELWLEGGMIKKLNHVQMLMGIFNPLFLTSNSKTCFFFFFFFFFFQDDAIHVSGRARRELHRSQGHQVHRRVAARSDPVPQLQEEDDDDADEEAEALLTRWIFGDTGPS